MTEFLNHIRQQTAGLPESARQVIELDVIAIEAGAIRKVAPYLEEKDYRRVIIVGDPATYAAAGKELEETLAGTGIAVYRTIIAPDAKGDVIADEASLIQLLLDIQKHAAEVAIAVGGGTIHDITRYSAYTMGIPFLSVPTAPSVDGFNSKGAPIIVRGEKNTIPAIGPDAIFADINILVQAPAALIAAGFGDMLGKYTSLFDWRFGSIVACEPYLQASYDMTWFALQKCVNGVDLIAQRREEGVGILMGSLIESGLAMLLFGQSHPASGAEHHLSHYWEMEYIRLGSKQLLHGAKVGVACIEISNLYHKIASEGAARWIGAHDMRDKMDSANHIANHWDEIAKEIRRIPDGVILGELLNRVGGPSTTEQLGVSAELLQRSLREAHRVRLGRFTLLRAWNELGSLNNKVL